MGGGGTMRVLQVILWGLVVMGLLAWYVFYVWIVGMACAFSTVRGNCTTAWPWELRGEDLWLMVLIPGGLVTGLAGAAWLVRDRGSIVAKVMLAFPVLVLLAFTVFASFVVT